MSKIKTLSGESVDYNRKRGAEIYRRSLIVLLQASAKELYPHVRIKIGQTLMHGYYFEEENGADLPEHFLSRVGERMKKMVKGREPFNCNMVSKKEALNMFTRAERRDKIRAVSFFAHKKISMVYLKKYFDFILAEPVKDAGELKVFKLIPYKKGFVMQYPVRNGDLTLPEETDRQEKLYRVYVETRNWDSIIGVSRVPDLNKAVRESNISTIMKVQEAFHEKKIAMIADMIKEAYPQKKIVFVSGPSASGKTTFIKRLGIQLRVNGLDPVEISLDDYFVPRDKTPLTPDGERDYECLEALDVKFLCGQLKHLMKGGEIILPKYNFKTGKREKTDKRLKLSDNSVVTVEGIHAMNPAVSEGIESKKKFGIFVSALTQLCIDNDSRIFTSDSRLMRRIIRDSLFRGYNAEKSLKQFPKVQEGEKKYVFPYQDKADVFFNSSLTYEQAVLKPFLLPRLEGLKKGTMEYYEARRLLNYLDFFLPVGPQQVPHTSIIREFIGESGFNY